MNRRVKTPEGASRAFLDIQERARKLEQFPPFGRILKDKTIGTSATTLTHNLGRRYNGYLIIRCDTQATFIENSSSKKETEISLTASASATVDIWIF